MRSILIILAFATTSCYAQDAADSLGFTNKAEARNQLVNGKKEGKWLEYVNASNLGLGLFQDMDTVYKLTIYKDGDPYGIIKIYKPNGKLWCEIPYRNGKENGIEKEYGKSNKNCILEIPWKDGRINGLMKDYYENGKVKREAPYIDDEPNGIAKEYSENGKLDEEITYNNGYITNRKSYDENGKEIK